MSDQAPQILLIEGDSTLLEITAFRLELLGYGVVSVDAAERAIEWLREKLPTLVKMARCLGSSGLALTSSERTPRLFAPKPTR